MSTKRVKRAYWLDHGCPPWCRAAHDNGDLVGDRIHRSDPVAEIPLTTMKPYESRVPDAAGQRYFLRVVTVFIDQHYREVEPRVHLEHDDRPSDTWYHMTLEEADRLGNAILEAVATARGQR